VGRTSEAREQLIEAAADLWHSRSYAGVGVSEICAAAGVQKGSFYHFFASKQDLALTVIDERWNELGTCGIGPLMTGALPPLDRIRTFIARGLQNQYALKEATGVAPGCTFGNLAVEMSSVDDVLRARLQEVFRDWAGFIRAALDDAVAAGDIPPTDTDRAARAILAYVEGLAVLVKAAQDPAVVADLTCLTLRLVGVEPEAEPEPALAPADERTTR
jgi:TetR/AcrR family transcriptional regulator, transcriptional repressor for nem operon